MAIIDGSSVSQACELCGAVRDKCQDVRVLMLTDSSMSQATLNAFRGAADDWLNKPFLPDELRARVRHLPARGVSPKAETAGARPARIAWGPFELRFDERILLVNDVACCLTPKQERLLARLIKGAGAVVSNDELWVDFGVFTPPNLANIRVHVHALRKRLGPEGALIVTFPSVGYGIGVESPTRSR